MDENGSARSDVSRALEAIGRGDERASGRLVEVLYGELRALAGNLMQREPATTLQPTALVHEAWMRLTGGGADWESRGHFFGAAARAMRRVLVDRARERGQLKRGASYGRVPMPEVLEGEAPLGDVLLQVDGALGRLEKVSPRHAQVVMLRYFAGLSIEDVAATLDVSVSRVNRDWRYAKAWLYEAIADCRPPPRP